MIAELMVFGFLCWGLYMMFIVSNIENPERAKWCITCHKWSLASHRIDGHIDASNTLPLAEVMKGYR